VTDLNPPDRLAEITERLNEAVRQAQELATPTTFATKAELRIERAVDDLCLVAQEALGELVETRTLADTQTLMLERRLSEARARTDELAAALDEALAERNAWIATAQGHLAAALRYEATAADAEAERDVERARADAAEANAESWMETAEANGVQAHRERARADQLQADLAAERAEIDSRILHATRLWTEKEELRAELVVLREKVAAARTIMERFARCPMGYEHRGKWTEADPRMLRYDCSDDQCDNPDCLRFQRCDHPSHDAVEWLAGSVDTPPPPKSPLCANDRHGHDCPGPCPVEPLTPEPTAEWLAALNADPLVQRVARHLPGVPVPPQEPPPCRA
jgi:hypothetical protein